MQKVNWGILGTSFISEVMAQAIQSSENAQLVWSVVERLKMLKNCQKIFSTFMRQL